MRLRWPWLAFVLVCFCAPLFAGLGRADIEGDEAIYSFGVQRMLEVGDPLAPRSSPSDDAIFLEKPPLKFWIVAAPMWLGLAPADEFGMRLWDAVFGGLAFLYVLAIGNRLAGPVCGVTAAFVLFVHVPLLFMHGIRTNNMEAPLLLSYAAGVWHYMAWAREDSATKARYQASAVGFAFVLGFMTKFVAALFLPVVLLVASLPFGDIRRRVFGQWRTWAGVVGLIVAICAPWFAYAHARFGMLLWETILKEHVYNRFTAFLDPAHLQPWHYYVAQIWSHLAEAGTRELVVGGLALLIVHTSRRRWFEGTLVLVWLVAPLTLVSLGTSKLYHYAYPFLPPLGLAAGFLVTFAIALLSLAVNAALRRLDAAFIRPRVTLVRVLDGPVVRRIATTMAVLSIVIAGITVAYGPVLLEWDGRTLFRSGGLTRPITVALVLGWLTASFRPTANAVATVLVASFLPFAGYQWTWTHMGRESKPMRTMTDCLLTVAGTQPDGDQVGLYIDVRPEVLTHGMNYYFRRIRPWSRAERPNPEALDRWMHGSSAVPPALVEDGTYQTFLGSLASVGVDGRTTVRSPSMVRFGEVLLLLPGPYKACAELPGTPSIRPQ